VRTIGVITTSRADYGIYRPLLEAIRSDPELRLRLLVSGMHLSTECGFTVRQIEADGFDIAERIETLVSSDSPQAISKSMGLALIGFAQMFARWRPDLLLVLGDRFEMHAAALAALPFKIPVAHLCGGELTEGAIDDVLRHSITKLSHLHFVSTAEYGRRVVQLGEEPWRVIVSGEPGLDNLNTVRLLTRKELEDGYGLSLERPFLLVTYHPVTLEYEDTEWQVEELLSALRAAGMPVIFTLPNADTANRIVREKIQQFVAADTSSKLVDNFGTQGYFSVMNLAAAMVGNSSSGVVEAASLALPVVNVGTRQRGRVRARNVIDVGYSRAEVLRAIKTATDPQFRSSLAGIVNPYGTGKACPIILQQLKNVTLGETLIRKKFHDFPSGGECASDNPNKPPR
jgi:UDP-hydrolysing UDP-N-acetyl-D-glucosamine 2-epimerase